MSGTNYHPHIGLLLLFFLFPIALGAQSQKTLLDKEVKLDIYAGSAEELLSHIEKKADVVFSYSSKVCLAKKVILSHRKAAIGTFLKQIFSTCFVEYTVSGNKILILPLKFNQLKFTIKGFVRDSLTGEVLSAATVFDMFGNKGTIANEFGFYSFTINGGSLVLGCSYVGYNMQYKKFNLTSDTVIHFSLVPQPELKEIPVFGTQFSTDIRSSRTGTIEIPVNQLQNVPSFLGEVDVLKTVQLFPGVQSGNEGFSGMYVRGGGADQNLILMDDVPVYNVDHLLGFFSVFNPDMISKITLIKGGFPAQYGGRLSSVLDIRFQDGNSNQLKGMASVGLVSSKVGLEGPLKKHTTFVLSFRRTYYDLLSYPFQDRDDDPSRYYFFDLNAKITHRFSDNSKVYLSTYWGKDRLYSKYNFKAVTRSIVDEDLNGKDLMLNDMINTGWGNIIVACRWNYVFNDKLFGNFTSSFNRYNFRSIQSQNYYSTEWNEIEKKYYSGIQDAMTKIDFDYYPVNGQHMKFGLNYTFHRFFPGIDVLRTKIGTDEEKDNTLGGKPLNGSEFHGYYQDDMVVNSFFRFNGGVHFSLFHTGIKKYYSIEPRLTLRFLISPRLSVKPAFASMTQYVHLLSTANVSLPTDLWLPVTSSIRPMKTWQTSLSTEYEYKKGFIFSVELYFKEINHLLDYRESQSFFDYSTSWTNKLTSGRGKSYGLELLVQRKIGSLTGWFGYTYSKSINQFDDLNHGKPFRSNHDRRHDATVFLNYQFKKGMDANVTWTYGSGKPVTLQSEKYYGPDLPTSLPSAGNVSENYSSRNSYTMPGFHRLDVGMNFPKQKTWGKRIWSVGVMNLYGRQNPFFLYFSDSENKTTGEISRKLKQFSLFAFPFPYLRYTIHF